MKFNGNQWNQQGFIENQWKSIKIIDIHYEIKKFNENQLKSNEN